MHGPDHDHAAPDRERVGADAARQLGAEIVARVDQEAVAARLAQLPAAALLAELEAIVEAVDNADPVRRRDRAGLWGRLLGRDLVAQAQPDPVDRRVRLRLAAAQTLAVELGARTADLQRLSDHMQQHAVDLCDLIARERHASGDATAAIAQDAALQRRLSHLEAILASWQACMAQIAMVRAHVAHVLDRHAQVRDLLVSLWRQRNSSEAAASKLDHGGLARLRDALHAQLAALPEPNPSLPAPSGADTARQPKEPSP